VSLFAKQVQYAQSTHRLGGNFERATTSCAVCHTHQGFLERMETGAWATSENIMDPAPINCRTCHQIHSTYTSADYALTATTPVKLNYTGVTQDFGAAAGNLCAQCHQARTFSPVPVIGGGNVTVSSSRYGTHHGPQAQVMAGEGAFEFSGPVSIVDGEHAHGLLTANQKMCATCHMGEAFGQQSGGHTWKMSYEYHGSEVDNVAGCQTCHPDADDFSYFGDLQGHVEELLVELEQQLVDFGIKRAMSEDYTIHGLNVYAFSGTYPATAAAAFVNWQMFAEDRSLGLHNPTYVRSVLVNTIAAMDALLNPPAE